MSKVEIIKRPIEQISWNIKKTAWVAAIESLATVILGILIVVWPDITTIVIANVIGGALIAVGIYRVINYFVIRGQNDFFNNDLLIGVVSILIGIAAIVVGDDIANIFRIVIGIWMVYEALVRINTAVKLHSAGIGAWKYVLIIGILVLAVGIFVTFNTGAVMQLIGWMMIVAGIIGIVGDIVYIQQVNAVVEKLTKQ